MSTNKYKAVAYIPHALKDKINKYAQENELSFSGAVERLLTYYAANQAIAVAITKEQKNKLEEIGMKNHRTMEGQAAAAITDWLEQQQPQ